MGVICREFSRESQLNNNCKTLFHSTGVTPEGDIISCINLPENSTLIPRFTAILNDAAGDAKRAKKMYVDSGARNGKSYCFVMLYVKCLCYNNTTSISLSPAYFMPTDKVHIWCQELVPFLAQRGEGGGSCDLPLARARHKSLLCGLREGRLRL